MKFLLSFLVFASFISSCFAIGATWQQKASLLIGRSDFHAVVDGDAVYVAGGCLNQPSANFCNNVTNTLEIYYPKMDKWEMGPVMPRSRYRYAAAVVDHKIYYVGGRYAAPNPTDGDFGVVVEEVDIFDTVAKKWLDSPAQLCLTCTHLSDAVAFAIGSKIYVTGGYTPAYDLLNRTIVLDTAATSAELKNQFRVGQAPDKIYAAGDSGAVVVGTKAYVYGGFATDGCQPLGTLEIFNSETNTWSLGASDGITIGRGDMGMVALQNSIYVMGGETKEKPCDPNKSVSVPIETITRYDINTNTWYNTTQILAFPRFRFSGFVYDNKLYDVGGQNAQVLGSFPIAHRVFALDLFDASSAATTHAALSVVIACFALVLLW